ncbi:UNVERIFIED_CONTAM: hypothetical protein Slati_4208700 [Sesamum latifolium]|uniref:Retrotransposon gag domain-containing protein n=1 Tax=Sesamum latifolium TaxID=2727402 RepID=A0AAW2TAH3_9LAMI
MFNNHQLTSLDAFIHSLELHFGLSSFDNHQTMLFKLRQQGTMTDFQAKFERLCNRMVSLPPKSILNYFIYGLRPDIQRELAVLLPSSISQAIGLPKLIEAKCSNARRPHVPLNAQPTPSQLPLLPAHPKKYRFLLPALLRLKCKPDVLTGYALIVTKNLPLAINAKLNSFSYFFPGSLIQIAFLLRTRILNLLYPGLSSFESTHGPIHFHMFDAVVSDLTSPRTLYLHGCILEHSVTIFVDSDSFHNILQPRVDAFLGLHSSPVAPFNVLVGNGASLS